MALRIVAESDPLPVDNITVCMHSAPGLGKTSTSFSAYDPFLIDFDSGAHRSANRRNCARCESWDDVADLGPYIAPAKTVIIDTAGRALDLLTKTIIDDDPKMGKNGQLSMQGYGRLKSTFLNWLTGIRLLRKDVILIAHSTEEKKGDDTVVRLDVQGGSKNEIYKCADVMGQIYLKDGKRFLNCNPTETGFGKNPANLPILEIPDFATNPNWFGDVIQRVKAALNAQSESQKASADYLALWVGRVGEALTPADFDALRLAINAESCSEATRATVKKCIQEHATAKGFKFDPTAQAFVKSAA